jgi:hypothetical protein
MRLKQSIDVTSNCLNNHIKASHGPLAAHVRNNSQQNHPASQASVHFLVFKYTILYINDLFVISFYPHRMWSWIRARMLFLPTAVFHFGSQHRYWHIVGTWEMPPKLQLQYFLEHSLQNLTQPALSPSLLSQVSLMKFPCFHFYTWTHERLTQINAETLLYAVLPGEVWWFVEGKGVFDIIRPT